MRKDFFFYYPHTKEEYGELWKNAIIVFDTNVMLALYKYSAKTRDEWVSVLQKLREGNRVYLPFQIGVEFHRNRHKTIQDEVKQLQTIQRHTEDAVNKLKSEFEKSKRLNEGKSRITVVEKAYKELNAALKADHPDYSKDDLVLESFDKIFSDRVGKEFDEKKVRELSTEARERYKLKIPPGFEDDKEKAEPAKFGDFFIWHDLIEHGKSSGKPIIFITDDRKEDWWLLDEEKKILMPHPLLRKEFKEKSGFLYYQYTPEQFIKLMKDLYTVSETTVQETEVVSKEDTVKREELKTARLEALKEIQGRANREMYENMLRHKVMHDSYDFDYLLTSAAVDAIPLEFKLSGDDNVSRLKKLIDEFDRIRAQKKKEP